MGIKYTSAVIFLIYIFVLGISNSNQYPVDIEGYYWRDFAGVIPGDAFVGGSTNTTGRKIYVAKVLIENKLIPAKLYEGSDVAYFELVGAKSTTKNIIILCSQTPENFQWISTSDDTIHLLSDRNLIIGGYQEAQGATTYIGRSKIEGEDAIGKILDGDHDYRGLWTVKDGKQYHFDSYEVLAYNPKPSERRKLDIDVRNTVFWTN